MNDFNMLMAAYCSIVGLTLILVLMNVHTVVQQLYKDHNRVRFYSYLGTLTITGSLIIIITGSVVDHVITSQLYLVSDTIQSAKAGRY